MKHKKYNFIALLIIGLFGIVLFYVGTDGFTAFTTETARVNELKSEQPSFPNVTLEDSKEREYAFSEFAGSYVFITFVYTACTDVCPELELNMAQVYDALPEEYVGEDINFLTISFDPERDDPETLETYRSYFGSDGETWRMARINDEEELDDLLRAFGVIVIPDGEGDFAHNSAFYLVDPDGYLVDVMDDQDIIGAVKTVEAVLNGKGEQG